jgi:hypothetical protein
VISKRDFYEGAALRMLLSARAAESVVRFQSPFCVLDGELHVYLKYSTKGRTPWGFAFSAEEQLMMTAVSKSVPLVIGLVCAADGVVALSFADYVTVAPMSEESVYISCHRRHGQHYAVKGPVGVLARKIAPSEWINL